MEQVAGPAHVPVTDGSSSARFRYRDRPRRVGAHGIPGLRPVCPDACARLPPRLRNREIGSQVAERIGGSGLGERDTVDAPHHRQIGEGVGSLHQKQRFVGGDDRRGDVTRHQGHHARDHAPRPEKW